MISESPDEASSQAIKAILATAPEPASASAAAGSGERRGGRLAERASRERLLDLDAPRRRGRARGGTRRAPRAARSGGAGTRSAAGSRRPRAAAARPPRPAPGRPARARARAASSSRDDDVRGADGLARLERESLRLVEAPLVEQHLREQPLALDERAAVLDRLEDADRLAQDLLRPCEVAPLPDDDAEPVQRSRRASALPRSRRRALAPASSATSASASRPSSAAWRPAARSVQPRVVGLPLVSSASSIARASGSCARSGSSRCVVDVVELEEHAALEVGAPDPLGDREPLGREPLDLVEVALPPADGAEHLERVEPAHVVGRPRRRRAPGRRARARSRCRRRGRARPARARSAPAPRCGDRPPACAASLTSSISVETVGKSVIRQAARAAR